MPSSKATWSDGLDGPALRIAGTDASPLRVVAGPGTGKTFALMRRVTRLLEEGAAPESIFVCTFTRTAAADLQTELSRLGIQSAKCVTAGTLHSFCFRLLAQAEVLQLTGRVPRPLLRFEERFLIEDLRGTNDEGIQDLRKRLNAFFAAWARLQSDEPGWPRDEADRKFLHALEGWLRFHRAMLVGELVPQTLRFLRSNPSSPHRPRFEYVLVDEYQDLNRAEQALLDEIDSNANLTVVGDEDQSIFSFKFAHPEGISAFDRHHPDTHDETLDECRRCPRRVVDMANYLISNNRHRTPRVLRPRPGNPNGEVLLVQWNSMEEEAAGIATFIARRIESGAIKPGRILVLAPRRQFGYAIRDSLNGVGVPAHSFFHEEALDGHPGQADGYEAQEAFTLLTLLAHPEDRVALRCWCGFGSKSLRSAAWARVRKQAMATGDPPDLVLRQLAEGQLTLPYTSELVRRFTSIEQELADMRSLKGGQLLESLFPGNAHWAEPIRALAANFDHDGPPSALLDIVRRAVTQPELPTDVDYVRVMSFHKSKGLTADLVVVVGCIEGLVPTIPHDATPEEDERALEEQRRLFYVAITRTRQTLVLSSVTRLPRAVAYQMGAQVRGGREYASTIASRFLDELGPSRPNAVPGASILGPVGGQG